jgi:NAD(P)-dependent dehydrogenase (short-subunit alcohol dehydrogenase family)
MVKGKVVAVTGGASGIGFAICQCFGRAGARVAMVDQNKEALQIQSKILQEQGVEVATFFSDVSQEEECRRAIQAILDHYGEIDILVNNAGITQRSAFIQTQAAVFHKVMAVNFFGALYCTQGALNSLVKRKGMIIVISSHAGYAPLLGRTAYCASKHALHGLFETLRTEVKDLGVHVMMVCPGFTKTKLQDRALGGNGTVTHHPQSKVGREDTPEQVAEQIFQGALKRKSMLVLTPIGKMTYWLSRLAPGLYETIMARQLREELIP